MDLLLATASLILGAAPGGSPPAPIPADWTLPAGTTTVYDTSLGPIQLDNLVIEAGAELRGVGPLPLIVFARESVTIDGLLDVSGTPAANVATLNTGNIPEPGGPGQAGGADGGTGSFLTTTSTPLGGNGLQPFGLPGLAGLPGRGGESGYATGNKNNRRPGGGGGGALGPPQLSPAAPGGSSVGLAPQAGQDGSPQSTGATSGLSPAQGGAPGAPFFQDGNPLNDFWGRKLHPTTGAVILGEAPFPVPGSGGGAGGDAVPSSTFPAAPWTPASDEKGAGGGGGAGVLVVDTKLLTVGPAGRVLAEGGDGAGGENTIFLDRLGGGSGGGSGGWIILDARRMDLSQAGALFLSARGGRGGAGANDVPGATSAGGDGGPGVIQLHVPPVPGTLVLPPGLTAGELGAPVPHVLLPQIL